MTAPKSSSKRAPAFSLSDFASALEAHDYNFTLGQVVSGRVIQHDPEGTYVDIGAKSLAFLPTSEVPVNSYEQLQKLLPVDSTHDFLIIREQNEDGELWLSLRRLWIMRTWIMLREYQAEAKVFECRIVGANNGGLLADVRGLRGFVPRSHLIDKDDPQELVGKTLSVVVLDLDEQRNRLILSHRQAVRSATLSHIARGQIISGVVSSIRPFGVFVSFQGVSGLLHLKEISQKYISDLSSLFQEGEEIKAVVLDVDETKHRISLSTKLFELHAGEILENKQQVFANAEERLAKNWGGGA
jgi:small subunit ribosomal protein S1